MEDDKRVITERYFETINVCNIELFGYIKLNFTQLRPICPFIEFIIERLNVVTHLTVQGNVWDAEIVHRSALETFIKFLFITSASDEEQDIRVKEFWEDLREIKSIELSEQAKKNIKLFGNEEIARLAYTPLILSEDEEDRLRTKWSKVSRQRLKQKWSFSEIIASLAKNYHGRSMEEIIGFTHSYRMASHVSHGDETGILIIKERNSRLPEEREIVNFAHYCRLLADSCRLCIWTAIETLSFLKKDPKFFISLKTSLADVEDLIERHHLKVYDDPIYDKFRS